MVADLDRFVAAVEARLAKGEAAYRDRPAATRPIGELVDELQQETLDLAGWGFLLWLRLERLRGAVKVADGCDFARNRTHSGTFAHALAAFEATGQLPLRPDLADLLLRRELLDVEAALLDAEDDRVLRARQKLLEAARQTDDPTLQRQARDQLRRRRATQEGVR